MEEPVLVVENLRISYKVGGTTVKAVRGVSLRLIRGESLCVIGESGSGKTTLAMAIAGLLPPNAIVESGSIVVNGLDVLKNWGYASKYVFLIPQDVGSALSPFHTVEEVFLDVIASRASISSGRDLREWVRDTARKVLGLVGLREPDRVLKSYPHELSGGMLQRVLIALAIVANPHILIADEPTSMIDASLKKDIVLLLKNVISSRRLSTLVITHDVALAPHLCDRVIVMYAGKIVEESSSHDIIRDPLHPYTRMLIDSIPLISKPKRPRAIPGVAPDLRSPPLGCAFKPRCPLAIEGLCDKVEPLLAQVDPGRRVSCHVVRGGDVYEASNSRGY